MNDINMLFDFDQKPLYFTKPIDIIKTYKSDEVHHCFEQIEEALRKGYYVAGCANYEVAYSIFDMTNPFENNHTPLLFFGVFEQPLSKIEIDHDEPNEYWVHKWQLPIQFKQYEEQFIKVINEIKKNKTEQINLTVPFHTSFYGDSFTYYKDLQQAQQSNYSAFLQLPYGKILSVSPELFFQYKDEKITVRPMKGTMERGKTIEEDKENFYTLQASNKNKYENKLITNLMKEELKQVATKDSIHVSQRYKIESYPTVYQMTSTISGTKKSDLRMTDIFKNLFPCGSISGTPKKETIKQIAKIEQYERGIYCGAIGYFSPQNEAVFNVPIRTVFIDEQNRAKYGAGGAITIQSNAQEEFAEIQAKTHVLSFHEKKLSLIETCLLEDGTIFLKDKHIDRLEQSAQYFQFPFEKNKLESILTNFTNQYEHGNYRLRLLLNEDGSIHTNITTLSNPTTKHIRLAPKPIDSNNIFLYHKTTNRSMYEQFSTKDIFDVLLWNERGEITECTIGNIVLSINDQLYTPPVTSGLLNGTFRQYLLEKKIIHEKVILKKDLCHVDRMWCINSVRKWVEVQIIS